MDSIKEKVEKVSDLAAQGNKAITHPTSGENCLFSAASSFG